jgi:hypothetical protein
MPVHHPARGASAHHLLSCCQAELPLPNDAEHGSFKALKLLPMNSHKLLLRSPYMHDNREEGEACSEQQVGGFACGLTQVVEHLVVGDCRCATRRGALPGGGGRP